MLGIGSSVGGWRIEAVLEDRGAVSVFAATRGETRGRLAFLDSSKATDPAAKGAFLRATNIASLVEHPSIERRLAEGIEGGSLYVVTDVSGNNLAGIAKAKARIPAGQALALALGLLEALAVLHEKGIVHSNVSPEAIVLTDASALKLVGLGHATLLQTRARPEHDADPRYASPELLVSAWDRFGPRSDLFSVAAVLFALLAGRSIHEHSNPNRALLAATRDPAPSLATVVPDMPADLVSLIDRGLAFDPSYRWSSAGEMASAARWAASRTPDVSLRALGERAAALHAAAPTSTGQAGTVFTSGNETAFATPPSSKARPLPFEKASALLTPRAIPIQPSEDTGTVFGARRTGTSLPFEEPTTVAQTESPAGTGTVFGARASDVPLPFSQRAPVAPPPAPPAPSFVESAPPPVEPTPKAAASSTLFAPAPAFTDERTKAVTGPASEPKSEKALPFADAPRSAPAPARRVLAVASSSTGTVFGARTAGAKTLPFRKQRPLVSFVKADAPAAAPAAPGAIDEATYVLVRAEVMTSQRPLSDVLEDKGIDEVEWHRYESALKASLGNAADHGKTDAAFELSRKIRAACEELRQS